MDKRLPPLKEKRENINTWQKDNRLDSTGHHKPKDKEISLKKLSRAESLEKRSAGCFMKPKSPVEFVSCTQRAN